MAGGIGKPTTPGLPAALSDAQPDESRCACVCTHLRLGTATFAPYVAHGRVLEGIDQAGSARGRSDHPVTDRRRDRAPISLVDCPM